MRRPDYQLDKNVALYARVSSKEQEQGYSIDAQLQLSREYAQRREFTIIREFIDVETAKRAGRTQFNEMLAYLRKHSTRIILVEKTDRLYRNFTDYVKLADLDVEIHLVKENEVISKESKAHQTLIHEIKVVLARNYILNLGEETKKGMLEKARAGFWPSFAPVGYKNVTREDGKHIIIPDPLTAPSITRLFKWFATGNYSLKSLAEKERTEGIRLRNLNIHKGTIHQVLRKRLYCGDFDWEGTTYKGTHEALVDKPTWERVQQILNAKQRPRKIKRDFLYSGMVRCGHCGCNLVGELKKGTYVYYHCTGNKGHCAEPYTRQERLNEEITRLLSTLILPTALITWLRTTIATDDDAQETARTETLRQAQQEHDRLQKRLDAMYLDKLDGRVTNEFYDQKAADWRQEQNALTARMNGLRTPTTGYQAAIDAIQAISNLCESYESLPSPAKRALLHAIIKTANWQHGEFRATLKNPFAQLAHSNQGSNRKQKGSGPTGGQTKNWLPKSYVIRIRERRIPVETDSPAVNQRVEFRRCVRQSPWANALCCCCPTRNPLILRADVIFAEHSRRLLPVLCR